MKTKEELEELKAECENIRKKLAELSEEELKEVTGGVNCAFIENKVIGNGGAINC